MLTTTLILGMLIGGMLASFLGLFRRPAGGAADAYRRSTCGSPGGVA